MHMFTGAKQTTSWAEIVRCEGLKVEAPSFCSVPLLAGAFCRVRRLCSSDILAPHTTVCVPDPCADSLYLQGPCCGLHCALCHDAGPGIFRARFTIPEVHL